jgi:hypothetical protein
MNYSKPEVKTLGEATVVIETLQQKQSTSQVDPQLKIFNPAYDLDE